MGKRLRKMARDIRQAWIKNTGWALKLLSSDDSAESIVVDDEADEPDEEEEEQVEDLDEENEESEEEEVAASPPAAKRPAAAEAAAILIKRPAAAILIKRPAAASSNGTTEYFYGFDWELSSAWREPAGGGPRAYAVARVSEDGNMAGHPVALFDISHGDVEIKALTNAELKDKMSTALYRKGNLWELDLPSGGRLRVARHSATSLTQPLFRLMLHLKGKPNASQSHPAEQRGIFVLLGAIALYSDCL